MEGSMRGSHTYRVKADLLKAAKSFSTEVCLFCFFSPTNHSAVVITERGLSRTAAAVNLTAWSSRLPDPNWRLMEQSRADIKFAASQRETSHLTAFDEPQLKLKADWPAVVVLPGFIAGG